MPARRYETMKARSLVQQMEAAMEAAAAAAAAAAAGRCTVFTCYG